MKMKKIYGGVAPERITALETQYDFHLPQDYREFLLTVGGGVADPFDQTNSFPMKELNDTLDVGVLYGIHTKKAVANIEYWMGEYGDEIWEHSVLIGDTSGGSFYVLVCEGEDAGVWFWDDCREYKFSSEKKNAYFVSRTFTEFIQLLGGKLELPWNRMWKPTEA